MSNKKQGLQPKLRFPEFRTAGDWSEDTLIEIAKFRRGSFPQPYGLPEWYDEECGMPFIQVFDVNDDLRLKAKTKSKISKLGAEQSVFIPTGTLIVTLQGSIGRVAITQYDAYIDRTLLLFEGFLKPLEKLFFAYVIQNLFALEKEKAPGGIIKTITKEVLSDFKVKLPTLIEQQKIADCLSSLDELITSQAQKIEALKAHKKGLMQQLFPMEGETTPSLRFPEFREAAGWEEKTLDELVNYENGKAHENFIVDSGKYVVVNSKFISTEGEVKKYTDMGFCIAKKDDILMVLSDVPNGKAIGKCYMVETDGLYTVNQRICRLTPQNIIGKFLFFTLDRNPFFLSFDDGVKQTNLRKEEVLSCLVFYPLLSNEQQKITDCLSSLDELISLQTQKLEALKTHKKGLMQQLFPAPDTNEVEE